MHHYIVNYISSQRSHIHTEPEVHAYTVHAQFAAKMQDGIFLLVKPPKNNVDKDQSIDTIASGPFKSFKMGFELVRDILADDHPMSLALVLSVLCELASHADRTDLGLATILDMLITLFGREAKLLLGEGHPLSTIFSLLAENRFSPPSTKSAATSANTLHNFILAALRLAVDQLAMPNPSGPHDWKTLYLRERLCDSLYHSGPAFNHERSALRAKLLVDQEAVYGPCRRNVLWTLTNVADDCLSQGEVEAATGYFSQALMRAETHTGYGRAKTRFAALEGLGRSMMKQAEAQGPTAMPSSGPDVFSVGVRADWNNQTAVPSDTNLQPHQAACCSCACHNPLALGSTSTSSLSFTMTTSASAPLPLASGSMQAERLSSRTETLKKALSYFSDAEKEAGLWFGDSSRRSLRVKTYKQDVLDMLREDGVEIGTGSGQVAGYQWDGWESELTVRGAPNFQDS